MLLENQALERAIGLRPGRDNRAELSWYEEYRREDIYSAAFLLHFGEDKAAHRDGGISVLLV